MPGTVQPRSDPHAEQARAAWQSARDAHRTAAQRTNAPEEYEALGTAAWWLQDTEDMLDARLTAYRLYRARGDNLSAARVATALGNDFFDFRGDPAVANGWFRRAARLLDDEAPSVQHAWLRTWEARLALLGRQDAEAGLARAEEALVLARDCGCTDAESLALAMRGLARVIAGETAEGMAQLDEAAAAALGGDIDDAYAAGLTCCYLISACERVRDYERAGQWCARLREFLTRQRFAILLTQCRLQYGSVLISTGQWGEAESELLAAIDELTVARPLVLPAAHARLGELRRRQGRTEEAADLFARAGSHPIAQVGTAWLEIAAGDTTAALDRASAWLRRFAGHLLIERAPGNELIVHAASRIGDTRRAREALAEIDAAAAAHPQQSLRALALSCAGIIAAAEGDGEAANDALQQAADLFEEAGLPFEAAAARSACEPVPRDGAAGGDRRGGAAGTDRRAGLSAREIEVLRLVADGLAERDIAARLFLSPHTVHRHLSNIRVKLGVSSRAAAVALALREGIL